MDLGGWTEEHLTTNSEGGHQSLDMSDLYVDECSHPNGKQSYTPGNEFGEGLQFLSDLRNHAVVHSGERMFGCETCKKRFTTLFNLRRHELIHTGERPFACMICCKTFTQQTTLRTHERIHVRESMYTCL